LDGSWTENLGELLRCAEIHFGVTQALDRFLA
jgi:hypothetical protein